MLCRSGDGEEEPLAEIPDIHEVELEDLAQADLDALPFGVVVVDDRGIITAYNTAESRISGLPPAEVIGRNFFTDVAPCTGVPHVLGRFLRGVRAGHCDFSVGFVFSFRRAPVRVRLRIMGPNLEGRYTIAVQPLEFLDASTPRRVEAPKVDLHTELSARSDCADEPIHYAAAIQPHGALVAIAPGSGRIVAVSDNLGDIVDRDADRALGARVSDVLGEELWGRLQSSEAVTPGDVVLSERVVLASEPVFVHVHLNPDGLLIAELELVISHDDRGDALSWLSYWSARIERAPTVAELERRLVAAASVLTGMERVLEYRFEPDWSGVAVAEARRGSRLPSLEGLRFPESDIPRQARDLYARSLFRSTPNTDYTPVPVRPLRVEGRALDLSYAQLRSVSPVHRIYHQNMGVRASLSVSLLDGDRLAGLLVGHASSPSYLTPERRDALGLLCRLSDRRRALLERRSASGEPEQHRAARSALVEQLSNAEDIALAFTDGPAHAASLFDATGIALVSREAVVSRGRVPPTHALRSLVQWLRGRLDELGERDRPGVFVTDHLVQVYPEWAPHLPIASGVAALRLDLVGELTALWFRPELPREVHWGGKPEKALGEIDGVERTLPRQSFERWVETTRGVCAPWPNWVPPTLAALRAQISAVLFGKLRTMEALNRELERLNTTRMTFLRTMSHELRTPLTAILGLLDLQDKRADGPSRVHPVTVEEAQVMRRSAENLLHLINDLLDYSRMEEGHLQLDALDFSPSRVAADVVELNRALASGRGLSLELELDETARDLWLTGDASRLQQVLVNLVGNAIKFTTTGGVVVRLTVVEDSTERVTLRVEVEDTGVGISEHDRGRLFQPFTQVDGSARRAREGTGLGLAISREIVEAMGGQIGVRSTPGTGSVFWFEVSLPEAVAGRTAKSGQPAEDDVLRAIAALGPRLLVADDNPVNRLVLTRMLTSLGCKVVCVEDGEKVLDALTSQSEASFDCVLLDLQMPVLDGIEAARRIRALEADEELSPQVILAISADTMGDAAVDHARFGFDDYLSKPIGRLALARALVSHIDGR